MFGKAVVLLAIIAAGYWYWSGPYQQGGSTRGDRQLHENAKNMERCMRQEASMNAASGMAGGAVGAGDPEALCAQKYGLYQHEGQWLSRDD